MINKLLLKVEEKSYKINVKPLMMHGSECQIFNKKEEMKIKLAKCNAYVKKLRVELIVAEIETMLFYGARVNAIKFACD